ncbi:uncharacterized protein PHACADRAFT_250538 [Phanerochaete carnosa HHB-10118-sp]|uniref:BTB domain-containing protein n=1 Tax=Phanerochaete carnosa (strain HHB-10118-sp) TaxID=650164 RepID=K5WKA4_PHACS|nr:uncharacterized protein PHACADRAFT_250538 [Phanerochaete carnosa HHB-10118-sp]EKM59805.1 hypothetical protein PHACADRAFT_250538 [Phanerochaete carnosa HHB-10118-sp]
MAYQPSFQINTPESLPDRNTIESPEWLQFVAEPFEGSTSASALASQLPTPPQTAKPIQEITLAPPPPSARASSSIPTPPDSNVGSPIDEPEDANVVSVSTTFFPGANLYTSAPDFVFISSDTVFFYIHSAVLLRESSNRFNSLVPALEEEDARRKGNVGPVVPVPQTSAVLNVVLHTIYGLSCLHYSPSNETLVAAVDALAKYGVDIKKHISPSTPLFQHILGKSPTAPAEFYAMAGHHNLWDLGVAVSPYMLSFPLADLEDVYVERMGSSYLKRLFFLHLGRVDALKRLLLPPPQGHPATLDCDFVEQKKLTRAWALASAYLAWDARADLSTTAIEVALRPLADHLSCHICRASLHERIKVLLVQWALVKRTI